LGKGEKQALRLYFQEKGDAIISDDRTFLNLLDRYNEKAETKGVPFITPANAIVTMENKGIISNKKAKRGLKQIEEIIRQSSYQAAMEELQSGGE
jgi:glutathione synthase/RimK-type ligase-like ATP-grasp enzyme